MSRFAVYFPIKVGKQAPGFVLQKSRPDYEQCPRKTIYETSPKPQDARVFYREADAKRVAKEAGGVVVPVMLWYGPHAPHARDWKP